MDTRFQLNFIVQQDGQLLREAISDWGISKRALTAIKFDGGELLVNGEERNVRHQLTKGDQVSIIFPSEEASEGLVAEKGPLKILYEDEALLVIDKPPYMNTIPSREHPAGSVANFVYGYFLEQQIASTVHIVTRLDRDTSGLMCIAKHRHIHHLMSEQQKAGAVHREYEALVHGIVRQAKQSIIAPIGRKETSIIEREVRGDGQFAHTDVTLLKLLSEPQPMSQIRLKLYTGRTHQIRVHMAHIGHPLVGDELYGGSRELLDRQALHCVWLQFVHPLTGENISFSSEIPEQLTPPRN
ncbi:RluA family pseudouridine synthase [Solibacillus sp. FSL H8-0538]|uniref:RluA family pseudouridine synthase n=1 Tax=Solibacillus sp. FSL H8-0538 TaxID=2921400 RepID=UPI0030FA5EAB